MIARTAESTATTSTTLRTFAAWCVGMSSLYALTWGVTKALTFWIEDVLHVVAQPMPQTQVPLYAFLFLIFFTPILYLIPCALSRTWLIPDVRNVILYSGAAYFFGCGLEVVMDPAFIFVLGRPCYLYFIWPIHHGHTSGFGIVMWPMYGFFVCLLHQAIHTRPQLAFLDGHWARAGLLAADAMLLEVAANVFSLVGFGSWLFRYHAPDLHHFTTVEAFPIYLLGGYVGLRVLRALERHPRRAEAGIALYVAMLVIAFAMERFVF